jgi:uncharacterized Rmd1/YagE family protein
MSNQSTAKRTPSILVTDVRTAPTSRSAPFVKNVPQQKTAKGRTHFDDISIDNLLSDIGDIPSAHKRAVPKFVGKRKSDPPRGYGAASQSKRPAMASPGGGGVVPRAVPPILSQNIPSRTTKLSQKLVLIPDDLEPGFHFEDVEDEIEPPPTPWKPEEEVDDLPRRSYAERLPRDRRTDKFPRVTAYCIADGMRLQACSEFLRDNHKIRPRIYDEALFAPYYLPLLPGDGEGSRVKSSPGGIMMLEQLIDLSEQGDHHFEYFSGGEASREIHDGHHRNSEARNDDEDDFDPSEPQDFSPRAHQSYLPGGSEPSPKPLPALAVRPREAHPSDDLKHAEIFIFSYGVIVFWNFTEHQEKAILADLTFGKNGTKSLAVRPINDNDIETEEMHFTYSPHTMKPRIYNDMITLRSGDHMIKLAMSHAIAQSTKLSRFEARMDVNMHDVKHVPRMLALTGKLGMKREEVLKISGKLFKLRVDVNLSSNVLDTPDFFWESEPSLNPLYTAIREYLEIEQRILVLNERCKVFLELADIIADSIAESNMSRITWIIIILIALSLGVSTCEIIMRFVLLKNVK